ncbi:MAG: SRPBCC family protein [Fulvivirga sp.]|uniref:SRPBCC family protein n=1 Tax=Fulvivirga sp. TaxID=1931237 RepID=UPI0032EA9DAC
MPKTHVEKKVMINAPVEKVYSVISDFKQWRPWSPWMVMEPEVVVDISEDNKFYEWKGNRIGSGNMKVTNQKENRWVEIDLNFLTPWKSYASVRFELNDKGDKTEVSWIMDSSLPFFMFFMKRMMEGFIGMDFERGLKMLKEYVEDGEIKSKLEFKGRDSFKGTKFIGIKTTTDMSKLGAQMSSDFDKLNQFMKDNASLAGGPVFSQYHKWDIVKQKVEYTSGVGVKDVPSNLPTNFIVGEIPDASVYTLRHVGSYEHLGNAWSTLNSMQRNKEFKYNKKIHPFEVYVSDPTQTAPKDLITDVNFAVK